MSEQLRRIGYIRTSPPDRHPNVQVDAPKQADRTELHAANGIVDPRQTLAEVLDLLGNGDALIIYRMDRLARDEYSVANFQQQLEAMGVTLVVTGNHEREGNDNAD